MEPQIEIVTVKNMSDYNERFSPHPSTATTHKVNLTDRSGGRITVHDPRLFDSNSDNEVSPRSEGDEGGHPRAKFNREIEMVNLRKVRPRLGFVTRRMLLTLEKGQINVLRKGISSHL